MVLEVAEQLDTLANRLVGTAGAGDREVEDRQCDLRTHTAVVHAVTGDLGVEIHVREAGDAALDLLGNGQVGTVAHERFIDPLGFGWPDVLFQPGHQWQIVGQAAEQGHGCMAVCIDQAGAEQHAGQFTHLLRRQLQRRVPWPDKGNAAIADTQAVLLEHHPSGLDGYQPGRQQQQVERGGSGGHRRLLPRQL